MDNLYFIPNNILTNFFKELTQKKKTINSFSFGKPNQNSCIHNNKELEYRAFKASGGESSSHTISYSISLANRANECATVLALRQT